MNHTVATPADRATGPAVKRVERTLATAQSTGYSESDVAALRRMLRKTGERATRRQIVNLLATAAGSAA